MRSVLRSEVGGNCSIYVVSPDSFCANAAALLARDQGFKSLYEHAWITSGGHWAWHWVTQYFGRV